MSVKINISYIFSIEQLSIQLLNNEIAKTTFCERENRLAKFEEEVDCAHTKMQDVLEMFLSTNKQEEKVVVFNFITHIHARKNTHMHILYILD